MDSFVALTLGGIVVLAAIVAIALLASVPIFLLWNWLMPVIFGLKEITLLQALGLSLLSSLLFGQKTASSSKD